MAAGVAALGLPAALVVAHGASLTIGSQRLGAIVSCVLSGYPKASTVAAETFVKQDKQTETNGDKSEIELGSEPAKNRRAFVRFDLAQCRPASRRARRSRAPPSGSSCPAPPNGTRTYEVRRVTAPCPEGLAACWGKAPSPGRASRDGGGGDRRHPGLLRRIVREPVLHLERDGRRRGLPLRHPELRLAHR